MAKQDQRPVEFIKILKMAREAKLKVKLLAWTRNPEQNVVAAIRQCYSAVGAVELKKKTDEETKKRLIKLVMDSGHTSTIEHASFTFAVEGISRVTEVQLVRHRIGTSFSIQSGRYVKRNEAGYKIPASIKNDKTLLKKFREHMDRTQKLYGELTEAGVTPEDARYCQPQSLQTKLVLTMNARALWHFFELRCCNRAQWEIRALASEMLKLVKKKAPLLFASAGPTCVSEKICWEGKMSCGRYKSLGGELRSRT